MKIFWSWQSDLPGNISRHFVREALELAIAELKQEPEIEDAVRGAELDHDRKGVPGSPDLAATIFAKIDECDVFIADVSTVGVVIANEKKRLINSNVAIEFGYALRSKGDRAILMVMNHAYGSVEDLPFDLRHKAGPIPYHLTPSSSKDEIATQRAQLTGALKSALRTVLTSMQSTVVESFPEAKPAADNPARFFDEGRVLVTEEGIPLRRAPLDLRCTADRLLYMRIIPTLVLPSFDRVTAMNAVVEGHLEVLDHRASGRSKNQNEHGVIVYAADRERAEITAATQLFKSREIWGFDADLLNDGVGIPTGVHEYRIALSLNKYLAFARDYLQVLPPISIEIGVTNVNGYILYLPRQRRSGPIHEQHIISRRTLNSFDFFEVDQLLLKFFKMIFDATGARRPDRYNEFPGDPAGTLPRN